MPRRRRGEAQARAAGALLASALALVACAREAPPAPAAAGNAAMAARLADLAARADPLTSAYEAGLLVSLYEAIEPPADAAGRSRHELALARALLLDGRSREAVARLERLREELAANPGRLTADEEAAARELLAIANLRWGEQSNCLAHPAAEACLYPLAGGGVHADARGARAALALYQEILADDPEALTARWLLNVSAMAAGAYPEAVPERWRIPPSAFAPEAPLARFVDVAPAAGADVLGLSGGVVADDLDGDGRLDLLVSSWSLRDPLRLLLSDGRGRFVDRSEAAGLAGLTGGLNLVHADYDNDGDNDVLVLRGAWLREGGRQPNSLLRNRGDGTFEDVTEAAGLLDFHPTQTAAWGDYDGDGWLDLFVANESLGLDIHRCRLFQSQRDGTFRDVAPQLGIDQTGFFKAVVWGDYDNDGRPDLYLSRLGGDNLLLRNEGPGAGGGWSFRDVTAAAGVAAPRNGFPAWFFDYDNDGWLDLFAASYARDFADDGGAAVADILGLPHDGELPRLYRNRGDGGFDDVTEAAGLARVLYAMGSNFGDLDNDGWLDLYVGTGAPDFRALMPNRMFRNDGGRRFADVTTVGGFGHLQKGHGVAFADFDEDGDQDVYAVLGGAFSGDVARNALFENPGGGGHWVTLRLEGTRSNRSAIGARLHLEVTDDGAPRLLHAVVSTGGSFGSASLQQELGLGAATRIDRLVVRWPSGLEQAFTGLAADRIWRLREGDATAIEVAPRPFALGRPTSPAPPAAGAGR